MRARMLIVLFLVAWVVPTHAQGVCDSVEAPWAENFDTYGNGTELMPPCWTAYRNYDMGYAPHLATAQHRSGTAALALFPGTLAESHYSMVIAPPLRTATLNGLHLKFAFYTNSTAVRFEVGICQDTGRYTRAFTPIDTLHATRSGEWQEVVIDLAPYSGLGQRVALRMKRDMQSGTDPVYIDDMRIESCGTSAPWVSHLTSTGLTLHFDAYGEGAVQVNYNGHTLDDAHSPLHIEGLTPSTTYAFSVGCEGGEQQVVEATTLEGVGYTPAYYQPFNQPPTGWRYLGNGQHSVAGGVLRLSTTGVDSLLAVLPLQEAAPSRQLTVALRHRTTGNAKLVVGVMEYGAEATSFTGIDTLPATPQWQPHVSPLAAYAGEGRYIALKLTGSGTAEVDDLRVARCMLTNLRIYNLTSQSVSIAWDTLIQPATEAIDMDGITLLPDSNPFTLDALPPSTPHTLYLHPQCGDDTCAYDRMQFTTFAHEVEVPYCADFEQDNGLPQGWVGSNGVGLHNAAHGGAHALALSDGATVALPLITADTLITMQYYLRGSGSMEVGLADNPYAEVEWQHTTAATTAWQQHQLPLAGLTSKVIMLRSHGTLYIDDLSLRRIALAEVEVSHTTQEGTTLTWQPPIEVLVEYAQVSSPGADFETGSATAIVATGGSLPLTALQPDSWYAIHLRPNDGCSSQLLHLHTLPPPTAVPYCANFDNLAPNAYPADWRRLSAYGEYPIVSTERNRTGRSLRFSATAASPTLALLPDMVGCGNHLSLSFWHNTIRGANGAMLVVGHLTDADDIASFVGIDTLPLSTTEQWIAHRVDVGGDGTRLAMMLVGGGAGETRTFIDDLCLEACAVYNLGASSTDTSLVIQWTGNDSDALEYRVVGNGINLTDTAHTSPIVVQGLEGASTYTVRLRALCQCGQAGGVYWAGMGSRGTVGTDTLYSFSIHTRPPLFTLPWCTHFDDWQTGIMHHYWGRTGSVVVTDRNYASEAHSLLMSGNSTLIAKPTAHLRQAIVSLNLYSADEAALTPGAVVIGVMNSPDSAHTFTMVDTLHIDHIGTWERKTLSLSAYSGTGTYLALRTTGNVQLYVDDMALDTAALLSAHISAEGWLSWQAMGNMQGVAIEYSETGRNSFTRDTAYTRPHPLPLDPSTTYEVRLTPLGGCMPLVLNVGQATGLPYCEMFDVTPIAAMPQGWLACRTMGGSPTLEGAGAGNQVLHLKGNTAVQSMVALPHLQADSLSDLELSLHVRSANAGSLLVVGQVDDQADPNTFHPYDTLQPPVAGQWVRMHLPLHRHTTALGRLALVCASLSQQAEVWVDSLSIVRGHTPQATALSARQVLLESLDSAYQVAIAREGTPLADAQLLPVDTTHYLLDGLAPSTTYWLYPLYAGATTACEPPLVVSTPAIRPLPYCLSDTTFANLILPEPEADDLSTLHLSLSLSGSEAVEVGVMSHLNDWSTFLPLDTVYALPDSVQHIALATYSGTARFIALRTVGGGNARLLQLGLTACPPPTAALDNANLLHLYGSGWVDIGEGRFRFAADTTLGPLADSSTYWLHFYCSEQEAGCMPSVMLTTTYTAQLPFCADSTSGWMPRFEADTLYARYTTPTGHTVHATLPNPTGRPTLPPTVLNLGLDRCQLPDSLVVVQPGNSQVLLDWPDSLSGFYIAYTLQGAPTSTTLLANQPPISLDLLPDTLYHLALHCRMGDSSCQAPQVLRTLPAPTALPYCTGFADLSYGELPAGWRVLADQPDNYARIEVGGRLTLRNYGGTTLLVLPQFEVDSLRRIAITLYARMRNSNGHTVQVGAMADANNAASFDPIESFTSIGGGIHRLFCSLKDYYGNGRFVALRLSDDDLLDIDSISISTCAAYNFRMVEHEATYVGFEWEQIGTPTVSIEYGERGFSAGCGTMVHPTTSPYTLEGLTPLTNYTFLLSASCSSEGGCAFQSPVDSLFIFSPKGTVGCIDYTDLTATYVSCNTGTYTNPTAVQEVVDYGYQSANSRHTVHFDTTERDPRTGGLLRTVPEGAQASVRLGNWATGGNAEPQAESITYAMTIDPDVADLLILKYAAVLQDPEHAPSLQPRFRLQILDSHGELIDSCGMADFIANASLGWNQAPNEVLWKDWTTVGLDLTTYAGQSILVRLTTNDCGEGSHFGYAYFTLECASRRMQSEGCSNVPSNRFTVPSGFAYKWYTNLSDNTISTSNSILVPSDNSITYFCHLSFIDKPTCHFTMSAFAGARYPLALFDTALAVADCAFDLTLYNRSTISNDGLTPLGTGEPVERFEWLLPDGSTSTASAPTLHVADTGWLQVQLVAGIANDQCLDTLQRSLHLVYPHPNAHIEAPDLWCEGSAAAAATVVDAATYQWAGGSIGTALLSPQADTLLTAYSINRNGCADTLHHLLQVAPTYHLPEADTLCASLNTYAWHDTTLHLQPYATGTEVYQLPRLSAQGCDSLHTLHLLRTPTYHIHHADTLCFADTLLFFDTVLRTTGQYMYATTTLMGCDSVVNLGLVVRPKSEGTDYQEACDSLRWIDGRLYQRDTTDVHYSLTNRHGCDSTATLHLALHSSYYHLQRDTLCQGERLVWRSHTLEADGLYADTLHSVHQCDSIRALRLKVNRTPIINIQSDYDCSTLVYTLVGETNVPNYRWHARPHDPLLDSANGLVAHAYPEVPTQYTLEVYYSGTHACPSHTTLRLEPAHRPTATMRATIGEEGTLLTLLDQGSDYDDRTWIVNHTPLDDHASYLSLPVPTEADTVWVSMVADDGHCTDTTTQLLPIDRSHLYIANIFTPTAETNNRFEVKGRSLSTYEIHIYNRHGILVYHGTSLTDSWDGTDLQGHNCPSGSYVYHITYTTLFRPNAKQKTVGTVTLVR